MKHNVDDMKKKKYTINIHERGYSCHKCKHSFSNLFDQYYCDKTDENGEEYDLEADKDCGGVYYDANGYVYET